MAKAVGDVTGEKQGGFATDGTPVTGFSHMHDSGTGGSPSLGNFPLWPQFGCAGDDINGCLFPKTQRGVSIINNTVVAKPGYFAMTLNTSVRAEMTVTNHTALYRFTFPTNSTTSAPLSPLLISDLTDLPDSRINGTAKVDGDTGRMTGTGVFAPSFGIGSYALHFCADFQGATIRDTGVWINNRAGSQPKNISVVSDGINSPPLPVGVYTWFEAPGDGNTITARVGMSFISVEQACSNAEAEIPGFDFDETAVAAADVWRDKLAVIAVDSIGVDDSFQTIFWSGVYRAMLSPQDYTGENPLWESDEPYYDSYYW